MSQEEPVMDLDQVTRLQIVASGIRGAVFFVEHLAAPFHAVWAVVSDLERELPNLVPDIRACGVVSAHGNRTRAQVVTALGEQTYFDIVLRDGWCLMQSRCVVGGMAAVPDGDGTRFAFLYAVRFAGSYPLRPLLRSRCTPLGHNMLRRLEERVALL